MGIKFYPNADEKIEIVLACDPDMQEANTEEALSAYMMKEDETNLVKPDTATVFVIRPLTPMQLSAARRKAGRPSVLGDEVKGKLHKAMAKANAAILEAIEKAIEEERELTDEEKESDKFKPEITIDDLTEKEYAALIVATEFDNKFNEELIRAGVVEVKGWKNADLSTIRPVSLQRDIKSELFIRILRLTNLGAEGKG